MSESDELPREELWRQYAHALDEYRFQVQLNWDRTKYLLTLDIGVIPAGTALLGLPRGSGTADNARNEGRTERASRSQVRPFGSDGDLCRAWPRPPRWYRDHPRGVVPAGDSQPVKDQAAESVAMVAI